MIINAPPGAGRPHRYSPVHNTLLRGPIEPKQYVSLGFGQAARDAGIARSMGSKGDCWDCDDCQGRSGGLTLAFD
jgi:hypothetical protein